MGDFFIADRSDVDRAAELLVVLGPLGAVHEAAQRAERSRDLGNLVHFCRWRQVERLLRALASDPDDMTLH